MATKLQYEAGSSSKSIPNPPGFQAVANAKDAQRNAIAKPDAGAIAAKNRKATDLKMRRAWDIAIAPAKSLPMQGVMLYFSGSGVQIFSLAMIFSLLTGPIGAVFGILKTFEALRPIATASNGRAGEPSYMPLIGPMVVYVACQGLVLSLGLYKCWSMGILPTGAADWLQFETRLPAPEWSAVRALSLG